MNLSIDMCLFLIFYFDNGSGRPSRKLIRYGGKNVMIVITFIWMKTCKCEHTHRCYFSQGEFLEIKKRLTLYVIIKPQPI